MKIEDWIGKPIWIAEMPIKGLDDKDENGYYGLLESRETVLLSIHPYGVIVNGVHYEGAHFIPWGIIRSMGPLD